MSRPHNRVYREPYRTEFGDGPYLCYWCDGTLLELETVHHLDKNPWNNDLSNLVAVHYDCHNVLHHVEMTMSDESNVARSMSLRADYATKTEEERKARTSAANQWWTGNKHSEQNLEKIRAAAQLRASIKVSCVKCRRVITASSRHSHLRSHERRGD